MLVHFRVVRLRFAIAPQERLSLPRYMASTLRGGFGAVFKGLVCVYDARSTPCQPCLLRHTCPYGAIFETAPPPGSQVLRGLANVPRPFVLEPPLDGKSRYDLGDTLEVGLVLIGRAIAYLPYFLVVLQELGRAGLGAARGRFTVKTVHGVNPLTGAESLVYQEGRVLPSEAEMGTGFPEVQEAATRMHLRDEITLRFLTPTRLVDNEKLVAKPEFRVLIRALLRRISSLAYFHCGERWGLDFRQVKEEAGQVRLARSDLRWWDWARYSARQQAQMKLGGFAGEVTYSGPVQPFLPLLLLGTAIHVGKACTFGHGRYEIA